VKITFSEETEVPILELKSVSNVKKIASQDRRENLNTVNSNVSSTARLTARNIKYKLPKKIQFSFEKTTRMVRKKVAKIHFR
jgi:hypothetical protein